ncbi:uncharacterized protein LOC141661128 [Apium graveolens]|uniref:uncharacterized protein LOC141661128 n=1 Tax=Apium graveolens TaxID=4045 RepID=UPI003D7C085F
MEVHNHVLDAIGKNENGLFFVYGSGGCGDAISYYSVDRVEDFGGTETELGLNFPIEYLNSLSIPGMPQHELKLKGVVVILMRNLNQTLGLCNEWSVAQVTVDYPSNLFTNKMPIQICYAMTINKSHGQSLKTAGLYLPNFVFTHGQFYVTVSRVTSPEGLHIFVDDEASCSTGKTDNVVYKEIFCNVPTV